MLIFVPALARSGLEPAFDASAADIVAYLRAIHSPLGDFGSIVMTVGLIAFLWFIMGMSMLLRAGEGDPPWRSALAAASGLVLLALAVAANTEAAAFRVDGISAQIARYAFDGGGMAERIRVRRLSDEEGRQLDRSCCGAMASRRRGIDERWWSWRRRRGTVLR